MCACAAVCYVDVDFFPIYDEFFVFFIISSYFCCSTFLEATPLMLFLLVYIAPLASLCRMPRMLEEYVSLFFLDSVIFFWTK